MSGLAVEACSEVLLEDAHAAASAAHDMTAAARLRVRYAREPDDGSIYVEESHEQTLLIGGSTRPNKGE